MHAATEVYVWSNKKSRCVLCERIGFFVFKKGGDVPGEREIYVVFVRLTNDQFVGFLRRPRVLAQVF